METGRLQVIIQMLEKQLNDRLEKLWRIFSWTSSILISLSGGMIVLQTTKGFTLGTFSRITVSFIVLVISLYGVQWINENLKFEKKIRDQLERIFLDEIKYASISELRPDKARFGYKHVILLLGITALFSAWVNLFIALK